MITRKTVDSWLPVIRLSNQPTHKKIIAWWRKATPEKRLAVVRWMNKNGVSDPVEFIYYMTNAL